ncbi:MAG: NAD-binding protein [Leptospira sp.]|nr:NAD-binding protein [Leptospira sp.]
MGNHNHKKNALFQEIKIKENFIKLLKYLLTLFVMILTYTITFHFIMLWEGREFSWITGAYWTLTTMSTLGFGDITFDSDVGKIFSVWVLLSGLVYLLVLFPYIFISLFYTPWMEFQTRHRLFQYNPENTSGHVIITELDPVAQSLIERLESYNIGYVILADTIEKARDWRDKDYIAIHGYFDDPEAYKKAKIENAIMVFANSSNEKQNTVAALTIRDLNPDIEIVSNVDNRDFQDILYLAGCNNTIDITEHMGRSFSRRSVAHKHHVSAIGKFGKLVVWEVPAYGACFQGKRIQDALNALRGLYVVGVWKRGEFLIPEVQEIITPDMILVVTGELENSECLEHIYSSDLFLDSHVLLIGCGRVGRATAHFLQRLGVEFKFLDNVAEREIRAIEEGIDMDGRFILGDGSKAEDLERAGLSKASTVIISTHDDSANAFLTLYCRKMRENVLILSRANLERNINTLHRAGADLVISYASSGAVLIFNIIRKSNNIMLEEGLELFRIPIPKSLQGKTIKECNVRRNSGCSIIAMIDQEGEITSLPSIDEKLPENVDLVLIGSPESEKKFLDQYIPR